MSAPPSPLSIRSTTPSPPPSPSFWKDLSSSPLPSMSQSPPEQSMTGSTKRIAKSPPTMEHRPAKKQKTKNVPRSTEQSPSPYSSPLQKDQQGVVQIDLDLYEHLRPPFEKLWDANAVPVPVVPLLVEQSAGEGGVLYFAYGKDMDPSYLSKLLDSSGVTGTLEFMGVGKLPKYRWVVVQSNRFPIIVESNAEGGVWGLVYRLSQPCMNTLNTKAAKRGLKMEKHKVETFEKSGMPGFWNAPLVSLGTATVQVMVGSIDQEQTRMDVEGGEQRTLQGSKKRKVLAGLLWGASEGLPEHWKAEIRAKAGGIKNPRDTQYWTMCTKKPKRLMGEKDWKKGSGFENEVLGRRSLRLDRKKKQVRWT
ncbi:hypothetical protein N431DRAFT_398227 [Stipitochalara longipes BDJ]|nr:hypothetical protein N431DRAFT_398227 [Stipitochalara longipes BDJ]